MQVQVYRYIEVNNTVLKSITSGLDPPVRPPLCNELWRRNRGDAHCSVGVRARAGYSPALQRCPVAHFILQRTVGEAAPRSSLRQIMHVGERVGPASAVVRLEWLTWLHSPQRLGAAWRLGQRLFETFRAQLCKRLARLYSATPASYLGVGKLLTTHGTTVLQI